MSLVAYAASSDEESENEDNCEKVEEIQETRNGFCNGNISDEEDYPTVTVELNQLKKSTLILPAPKNTFNNDTSTDESKEITTPIFSQLPAPKSISIKKNEIIEEDDEFLHKKAIPLESIEKEKPPPIKKRVQISIPSLEEFNDVDAKLSITEFNTTKKTSKLSSLLSILPPAKSEQNFSKSTAGPNLPSTSSLLIPDTVKNRRPALNTENIDSNLKTKKPSSMNQRKHELVECSDSDDDNKSNEDFFSLNTEDKLPEVSLNEIHQLVAKRAAQMAEASKKPVDFQSNHSLESNTENKLIEDENTNNELDDSAIQALVGNRSKRRKKNDEQIQVIEISSKQIHPSREEWMRTALASSTTYQPTGVLVDEEPAAGTRRKHQITYLAHKAIANEAELQAMWSANRHARQATQSKYGF